MYERNLDASPNRTSNASNCSVRSWEGTPRHTERWPTSVTSGRISVSPPETIAKIPELSPPVGLEESPSEVYVDTINGIGSSCSDLQIAMPDGKNMHDEPDGSPVYQTTTTSRRRRSTGDSDLDELVTVPPPKGIVNATKHWIKNRRDSIENMHCTSRQMIIMVVLGVVTLTSSFAVCLFPPFFPKIAQSKGCTTTVFGLIIGTNCLVAFLVTPTVGKNLEKIGVKFSFVMGAFVSGGCCILSGFLEWFPPGWEFVLEAVLVRAVHACSNAFVITSTFAFIVVEFPDHIAKLFAMTRTLMNFAQMLGPVVGGALYEVGGFKMPFLVLGSVQMTVALICIYALPNYRRKIVACEQTPRREISFRDVFSIPAMWISFCTFIFSTMSNGFLSITLEPLVLRKFNMSNVYVGLLFGLKDGANSLASPMWGIMCDRMKRLRPLILISTVLAGCSFILIGPFPGLPIETTLTVVVIALVLNGFGIGGQQVAGVVHAMNMAVAADLPDNAATHGFIAGIWSSLSGAGRFISRAASGFLTDRIGFRYCSMIVVFLHCIVFVVTLSFMICEHIGVCRREDAVTDKSEHSPLCTVNVCVCDDPITMAATNTPSEALSTKAISIPVPNIHEDLEGSMVYGSVRSVSSRRLYCGSMSPISMNASGNLKLALGQGAHDISS